MKIFNEDGYLNFDYIMSKGLTHTFICGGRGIGKSFGILKWCIDNEVSFIYMRRTQTQVDLIKNDDFNPFKALENVLGESYRFMTMKVNRNITAVYRTEYNTEKEKLEPVGVPLGYILALSTIRAVRGWSSTAKILIYDEFVPEKHERPLRGEGERLLNAMETIGRNRSLNNEEPLKLVALSNSNMLANPVFIELQMVGIAEKMIANNEYIRNYPDRQLTLILLSKTPISEKKAETALYKLAGKESDFFRMAINNEFTKEEIQDIKSMNLKEYKPLVNVGELAIYEHKSRNEWYVCGHKSGTVSQYQTGPMELKRFTRDYYFLWLAYMNRSIIFESYVYKVLLEKYFNIW